MQHILHQHIHSKSSSETSTSLSPLPTTPTPSEQTNTGDIELPRKSVISDNKHKMVYHEDKDVIMIKNERGKPKMYCRYTAAYKGSAEACPRTIKRRSAERHKYGELLSGSTSEDVKVQAAFDFKMQPKEVQSHVTKEMDSHVEIDPLTSLAFKEEIGLSWSQQAKVNRFGREHKIKFASEGKCRKESKALVEGKVGVTMISDKTETANGMKHTNYQMAHVHDLQAFVIGLLEEYKKHGKLTWHGEHGIPEDEIWIKLGGDHGKGSMKMCVQIANLEKPNARENTHAVAIVNAKDSNEILSEICVYLNPELKKLKKMTWNGYKFRIFLFGDYVFLYSIFGLSGQAGKHPCLWCNIELNDLRAGAELTSGALTDRTLTSIKRQYLKFKESGSDIKQAKEYGNCVRPVLLDIDIEMVVPMYLHIHMGIIVKHHDLLKVEIDAIDAMLAKQFVGDEKFISTGFTQFDKYVLDKRELKELIEERNRLSETFEDCAVRGNTLAKFQKQHKEIQERIEELREDVNGNGLKPGVGPIACSIEAILDTHGISTQAYHGGTFNGNHANKYIKPKVFADITDRICKKVEKMTKKASIIQASSNVKEKFNNLNKAYHAVHQAISHTKQIDETAQSQLQTDIDSYIKLFKESFPEQNILPKMHILQSHCTTFIESTGFGLGLLGEQGGELLHSTLSKLEQRTRGIRNARKRMLSTLESHHLMNSSALRNRFPEIKLRGPREKKVRIEKENSTE